MSDDAAVTLAKKILQDADKSPPKGTRPLPFIIRGGNLPAGGGSLSDIYKQNMTSIVEMEASHRTDQLARKQLTAWEKTAEAEALRAERDLERLKRGEDGVGSGGPINQIRDTLQAMTALEQFKGGNQGVEQLRMIMDNNLKNQEMFSRLMLEMEKQRTDMMTQMGTLRETTVKAQMEGIVGEMKARMEMLKDQGDFAAKLREIQKFQEIIGKGPLDEAQAKALKTLELEVEIKKKQMDMEQARWQADKQSTNEILKTAIGVLGAAAAPVIAKLAERAMSAAPALGAGTPPGAVQAGASQMPKIFTFPQPTDAVFSLECGQCKNQWGCQQGSDLYICPKCGAGHKGVPQGPP